MNDKKAKAIRTVARKLTVGKEDTQYNQSHGTIRLTKDCTRGMYRHLKRIAKRSTSQHP